MTKAKMTATEKLRRNKARNLAVASKKAAQLAAKGIDAILADIVDAVGLGESKARVGAIAMRDEYGPQWYFLLEKESDRLSDNEKGAKESVVAKRKAMRERAIAKGHSNPDAAWSALKREAKALDNPNGETREPKPMTQRSRETAQRLYIAIQKKLNSGDVPEDVAETLMEDGEAYASILVRYGVNIAALAAKHNL